MHYTVERAYKVTFSAMELRLIGLALLGKLPLSDRAAALELNVKMQSQWTHVSREEADRAHWAREHAQRALAEAQRALADAAGVEPPPEPAPEPPRG